MGADESHQLVTGKAPQQEEQERVTVELVGQQVDEGRGVLAGLGPVGAAAVPAQVAGPGQQLHVGRGRVGDDAGIQLAVEQRGHVRRPGADRGGDLLPLRRGQRLHPDVGAVHVAVAALDRCGRVAGSDRDGADRALAGVGAAS